MNIVNKRRSYPRIQNFYYGIQRLSIARAREQQEDPYLPDLRCRRKVIRGKQESVDATLREGITAKTLIREPHGELFRGSGFKSTPYVIHIRRNISGWVPGKGLGRERWVVHARRDGGWINHLINCHTCRTFTRDFRRIWLARKLRRAGHRNARLPFHAPLQHQL
jgi:hypothetical protein